MENDPTHADAHRLLAQILTASGHIADAVAACQRVAELAPLDAANLHSLAELLLALGRPADALATFDLTLRHAPQLLGARRGRIHALLALAQPQVALTACEELLTAQPAIARVRSLRALALLALQRPSDALAAANEATMVEPADAQAHVAMGGAALAAGLPERALPAFERALALSPTLANAHAGLGLALLASSRETEAIDALARAVQQDPQGATGAFLEAGYQMLQLGHPGSAHAAFCKLLEAQPDHPEAQEGRVIALIAMSRYDEAAAGLAALRGASPATDYLAGISLHVQLQCCDWTDFDTSIRELAERVRRGERADAPLTFIVHNESQADQRLCAQTYVAHKCSVDVPGLPRRARGAESRLRVGYLSSDFRNHAVAQLAIGVFESHDRSRFETYAFSTGPDDGSELRRRTERSFDHFLQLAALSDMAIASRMAELSIDIVIDLGGHSLGGRPRVLAYRPAPIQVVRPIGRDPWNWGMFEMITTIAPHVTQSSPYELRGLLIFDRQEGKSVGESAADGIGALILDNQFYLGLNTPTVASTSIDLTWLTGSTHIDMMLWLLPLEAIGPGVPIYDARYYEFDVLHTTPEPGTLVLVGTGLGLVGWRLRRRLGWHPHH